MTFICRASFVILACVSAVATLVIMAKFMLFLSTQTAQIEESEDPVLQLFTVDTCLVVLFTIQHSGLASHTYKSWMADLGLAPVTRSLYALTTSLVLQVLMYFWQPIFNYSFWVIDTSEAPLLRLFFTLLHITLWAILLVEVKVMEPLFLLGIKQVFYNLKGRVAPDNDLPAPLLQFLSHMPHPGATCFVLILWLHPQMTFDRGILATVLTAYVCCGMDVRETDYTYIQQYSEEKITTSHYVKKVAY